MPRRSCVLFVRYLGERAVNSNWRVLQLAIGGIREDAMFVVNFGGGARMDDVWRCACMIDRSFVRSVFGAV